MFKRIYGASSSSSKKTQSPPSPQINDKPLENNTNSINKPEPELNILEQLIYEKLKDASDERDYPNNTNDKSIQNKIIENIKKLDDTVKSKVKNIFKKGIEFSMELHEKVLINGKFLSQGHILYEYMIFIECLPILQHEDLEINLKTNLMNLLMDNENNTILDHKFPIRLVNDLNDLKAELFPSEPKQKGGKTSKKKKTARKGNKSKNKKTKKRRRRR